MDSIYEVLVSKSVQRAIQRESQAVVRKKKERILRLLAEDPFYLPPRYEKLSEDTNLYSRRVNVQHRVVYKVDKQRQQVVVIGVRSHYER
ncbi:Txe/YoeB family addiction module toxin [Lacticaseibacillus pabuli]|uniref:Endoribonuclease YoeB n=1 Tax=Lacticaseibacillus pabuli TaxID=3025672 RepID=A0ABY7WVR2_9LACO|nr:Txe/YoeB family addiction module toxin [Lacticaseibacillus sp. KACC 23028]WDF83154.1 Txe/YoeB family addiction module toxin [Lacticaseibacillus sp. KACC 23028]